MATTMKTAFSAAFAAEIQALRQGGLEGVRVADLVAHPAPRPAFGEVGALIQRFC